jgi:hypothetical protein
MRKITELTPTRGFSPELAALFFFTLKGIFG